MIVADEDAQAKDYEDPKTTKPESHYEKQPAASGPVNPIYQPLTVSTLERESCYAAPVVNTSARSGKGGGSKGKKAPLPPPHAGINTANYANTQIIRH